LARRFRVVGGGVSGLSAALLLARRGAAVELLCRDPTPGGLAGAWTFRGVPCDLGSHRLHRDALDEPLLREMTRDLRFLERPRRGALALRGRWIPYPLGLGGLLRGLGARTAVSLGASLLRARAARAEPWEDVGYEGALVPVVGRAAFEAFYRPYAEKVFGVDAGEVSQTVARLRVSTSRPWALLAGAAGREARVYLYPREGFGAIARWLEREALRLGVAITYGVSWNSDDGCTSCERTLFAGDLRDLVATPLAHRGVYLVYLAARGEHLSSVETLYTPEARYLFGRVGNVGGYAPGRAPPGETILCVEVPEGRHGLGLDLTQGEGLRALRAQLAQVGALPREAKVLEVSQRFVPGVYPLYLRGWRRHWSEALARVPPAVLPFGRQGLFLHCNTDHCVGLAAEAVAHAWAGGDLAGWAPRARRWLSVRVRD
jgi:hypothetical protein